MITIRACVKAGKLKVKNLCRFETNGKAALCVQHLHMYKKTFSAGTYIAMADTSNFNFSCSFYLL